MYAQVTLLRHWKSEHTQQTCEDAAAVAPERGLFAMADGAGTTLFSGPWATFLVQHFLTLPLLSNDPFESEWWLRQAQETFNSQLPTSDLPWNAQQKAQEQGSYATLATLRVTSYTTQNIYAELLAFGDTCIFALGPDLEPIFSFPLSDPAAFVQAPICLPSKIGAFQRSFQHAQRYTLPLRVVDTVVVATDAVAQWVLSAGNGRYPTQKAALQQVSSQTSASWVAFIQDCRDRHEMIDDDSTVLLLTFSTVPTSESTPLGCTTEHSQSVRAQRKAEFLQALHDNHKERVAISFGDGQDLRAEGVELAPEELQRAQQVADAQRELLSQLRLHLNRPDVVAVLTPLWQKYAPLLAEEPCAAPLRQTLARIGLSLAPVIAQRRREGEQA